ncbi:MFS transporter, MHS family, proline/betaine transporter [Saccharopolyspora kobensis]|uniref:Putative proline/betaine transporter n=1 Tax=Saccharopolyspora kobensis TaxID=146035 RepID=A0A1H6AL21_9PSEU|nr:MFS transporter [Saccharopolyspora kobensis]SEG48725.1 MFS transporter, MHS family, proline/betaine transporter [Saccharopolyspora kobensis]SFE58293.1 MFS transporter, MHS family, proline/betaine transporter [Saccharopolyspora kobensis]
MSGPAPRSAADAALDAAVQADPATLRRSVAAGAIGVFVHWFDWAVYAYLATTIATVFFPAENEVAGVLSVFAVFAVSFAIRPLGALVFGPLGDRIGRRRTLSIVIIVMSLATLAIGLLPGYGTIGMAAPVLLVAIRLVQGFAAGGEFGSAASFLAEYSPRARRGFGVSWLEVGSLLGFLSGSFAFYLLSVSLTPEQITDWGWRIPFLIAAPMGVIGYVIRTKIEDTPEYRVLEATDSVSRSPVKELFRVNWRQLLQAAGLMTLMHVPFYAVLTYLVTYQTDHLGHSAESAALLSTFISLLGLVLVPVFGRMSDRIGRKPVLVGAAAALLVVATPAYLLMQTGMLGTVVAGLVLAVILSAILGSYAVWAAEIFPTRTRQSGLSIAYNITAALFAGTVPFLMTVLISATGSLLVPGPYLMVAAAIGLVAALSMRETAGSSLLQAQDIDAAEQPAGTFAAKGDS